MVCDLAHGKAGWTFCLFGNLASVGDLFRRPQLVSQLLLDSLLNVVLYAVGWFATFALRRWPRMKS